MNRNPPEFLSELTTYELLDVLCRILTGDITSSELAADPTKIPVLLGMGGSHAVNLLSDPSGSRLAYWPRAWAARTLAIIGDSSCSDALNSAAHDEAWRVRMQVVRAAGLVADPATVDRIAELLVDDSCRRVREAVARSLGRNGSQLCVGLLHALTRDGEISVRRAAERAVELRENSIRLRVHV